MFSSIKVRIVVSITIVLGLFLAGIYFGGEKLQSQLFSSYESQAVKEQEFLLGSLIKQESEAIQGYLKLWLDGENTAPLFEDEPNLDDWADSIFTMGNQLAVQWHVTAIITYDSDIKLIYNNDTELKKGKFSYDLAKLKYLAAESYDGEKSLTAFSSASDKEPLIVNVIPSKDEDGDIAHIHVVVMRFQAVLARFKQSTGYDSELRASTFSMRNIDDWPYSADKDGDHYVDKEGQVFLPRTLNLSKIFDGGNESLFITTYPNVTNVQNETDATKKVVSLSVAAIFIIALVAVFALVFFLLSPINKILAVIAKAKEGDYSHQVNYKSRSEIGILAESFNHLLGTIETHLNKIIEKNRDIQSILSNLKQGILTTDNELKVHPEYSPFLGSLVEQRSLGGKDVMDVLFPGDSLTPDQRDQVKNSLELSEDLLSYEMNSGHLIKEYQLQVRGKTKDIEIDFVPISLDEDNIDKILISLRDVTELNKLKKAVVAQTNQMNIINQILNVSVARFEPFLTKAGGMIIEMFSGISVLSQDRKEDVLEPLYIHLHTLKGNCRVLNLSYMVDAVHDAETAVQNMRAPDVKVDKEMLKKHVSNVEESLILYQDIFENRIKAMLNENGASDPKLGQGLLDIGSALDSEWRDYYRLKNEVGLKIITPLKREIDLLCLQPLSDLLVDVVANLPKMAKDLGQSPPKLIMMGDDIKVLSYRAALLQDVIMHLLSNSLCHGFAEYLGDASKESPNINMDFTVKGSGVQLNFYDNGKGLDIEAIASKALSLNLPAAKKANSREEKANLIFEVGLSTQEHVSTLAGRGAGLGAVKEMVELADGEILLGLDNLLPSGRYAFKLQLTLPLLPPKFDNELEMQVAS